MKKALLFLGIMAVSFFGFKPAHAALNQTIYNTILNPTYSSSVGIGEIWDIDTGGSSIDPNTTNGQIEGIKIWVRNNTNETCDVELKIFNTDLSQITSNNWQTISSDYRLLEFTFTSSSSFLENNIWYFTLDSYQDGTSPCPNATAFEVSAYGGTDAYPYANGFRGNNTNTSTIDIFFQVNSGNGYSSSSPMIYFINTPTSTCNFENWQVHNVIDDSYDTTNWSAEVMFGTQPESYGQFYQNNYGGLGSLSYNYGIPKPTPLTSEQVYYARAYLCNSTNPYDCDFSLSSNSDHIIASSSNWEFIITPPELCSSTPLYYPGFSWPFRTTTDGISVADFSCNYGCAGMSSVTEQLLCGVKEGLCGIFTALFVPSPNSLDNFRNLKTEIQNKPPFGYVVAYTSTTQAITTSTATTTVDFSWTNNISLFSDIRTILVMLVWLGFLVWAIKRFTNFSLHG